MNIIQNKKAKLQLHLHRRAFHHMNRIKPGMKVVCEQGVIWVTNASDPKDYMLSRGASMVIGGKSDILLEALCDADVSIFYPN